AICAALGTLLTRRAKARFLADWRERQRTRREQARVREELALAREVQLSMLPAGVPDLPWLDVAAACLPASEVGGDYYDFFPLPDGLAVTVADVAGHGVPSGLMLATVRSGLALLMEDGAAADTVLPRLDRLVRRGSRRMLVSLLLVRVEQERRRLVVTAAGHPPLLLRRADGTLAEIELPGPPLGTRLHHQQAVATVPFAAGDACLLYTDGLVETAAASGEPYGSTRLGALLAAHDPGAGAAALCAAVLADVATHRGEAPQHDDVTLVVLVAR
ncbi:MAG TPA: SpoIIE family protein phosphatase, partial [Thermoanaerobaculia bacterium]|nr:SpoIIE family protein phosphatase [Thermoanaerobaculia bacterium]